MNQPIFTDKDYLDSQFRGVREAIRDGAKRMDRHEHEHDRNKKVISGLLGLLAGLLGFKASGG